jgi:hypothetical protein
MGADQGLTAISRQCPSRQKPKFIKAAMGRCRTMSRETGLRGGDRSRMTVDRAGRIGQAGPNWSSRVRAVALTGGAASRSGERDPAIEAANGARADCSPNPESPGGATQAIGHRAGTVAGDAYANAAADRGERADHEPGTA